MIMGNAPIKILSIFVDMFMLFGYPGKVPWYLGLGEKRLPHKKRAVLG